MGDDFHFEDFTDKSYARIVGEAAGRYAFEPFGTSVDACHVLWRHDVDFSVHRAVRMAEIEADAGARATYFLRLRGPFYNLLEPALTKRVSRIAGMGHWIGLHFDPPWNEPAASADQLDEALASDRRLLAEITGQPIDAFSFHNPGTWGAEGVDAVQLAGMVNAYGASVKRDYEYVSDSNGHWRHERLPDVIAEGGHERLHVLTHPEWWQAEAMSPRERLERCLEGRADHAREAYAGPVREWGRELPG